MAITRAAARKILHLTVSPDAVETVISQLVSVLKAGQVIAVPTDTIYGVACLAQCTSAVQKMYDIKRRDLKKPIAVCVAELDDIPKIANVPIPEDLVAQLLPGPVTLVMNRSEDLNKELNPFTQLVGVRIPDHGFIRQLVRACGEPLALTSANLSAQPSSLQITDFQPIWSKLALIVDGGIIPGNNRAGSTVVDVSSPHGYKIVRAGEAADQTVAKLHKFKIFNAEDGGH
eukprot:m.29446 g.29446  ORF g.29446 m.29446 type:complete len:230 (-) comp13716_c0_seq1:223-912(-)